MRALRFVGVIAGVLLVATLAFSQDPGTQPRRGGGGQPGQGMRRNMGGFMYLGLLKMEDVQVELKLTDAQKETVKSYPDRPGRPAAGEQPVDYAAKIKELLQPGQMARLKELSLQAQGPSVLARDTDLQKELKITDDQKTKMTDIQQSARDAMREEMQGGNTDPEAMRTKMQEIQKLTGEKILGVLTADQKAQYTKMLGKTFKFKTQPGMFGGFGRGGGRGNRGGGNPPGGGNPGGGGGGGG